MKKLSYPVTYGLLIAIGLIAYFLILSLFGQHVNPAYSIFNMVILGIGLHFAITRYKEDKGAKFRFQKGFMVGLTTGFIATAIFTGFFGVYATELDPGFLEELITMWETDWFINIGMVIFTVALMGIASTLVITFALNQLHKNTRNTREGREHTY